MFLTLRIDDECQIFTLSVRALDTYGILKGTT